MLLSPPSVKYYRFFLASCVLFALFLSLFYFIVIALDEIYSSAVLSFACLFFCEAAVGIGASVERDQCSRFAHARLIVKYG